MPQTYQSLPLQTFLGWKLHEHTNSIGGVYILDTPMGERTIETHETVHKFLGASQRVQKDYEDIVKELRGIESQAVSHLIQEWQKKSLIKE